jgi:acetyl-CoA acetyltransferase
LEILERHAAITGIGQSAVGRRLERTGMSLALDSCLQAISDAGLTPADIDGVANWPGKHPITARSPLTIGDVKEALGLRLNWYCGGQEGPGQLASVINATMAVATGQARHVLVHRTLVEGSGRGEMSQDRAADDGAKGHLAWSRPFNAFGAISPMAICAQRYFHDFGMTREDLAQIALNARRNAMRNPKAVMRSALTIDDYMSARMISSPLCLFDCDVPVDCSTAFVISSLDAARDCRRLPIRFEAVSGAIYGRDSWDQFDDLTTMAARDASKRLWERTDLRPKDIDVAELYDGFSILTVFWLEALGFCQKGECKSFIDGGQRIAIDGDIPLNTNGGQLSGGRTHGLGYLHEACVQLRGDGGERQVTRRKPNVAIVSAGGGPLAGCVILRND